MVGLTKKHDTAVSALLTHATIAEAARACGTSEATIFRWLQLPEFQERYREARREVWTQTLARLQQAGTSAVATLEEIAADRAAAATARVSAARAILEHGRLALEVSDLEARLSALEEAKAAQEARRG